MIYYFENLSAMLNSTQVIKDDTCITYGYYTPGDNGGGIYNIKKSGTANNIYSFNVNGLIAVLSDFHTVNAETIGILPTSEKPVGAESNSTILNNFLNAVPYQYGSKEIVFNAKEYDFDNTIILTNNNQHIRFTGKPGNKLIYTGTGTFIEYNNARYIYFEKITFDTNDTDYTKTCVTINGARSFDFFFSDCRFFGFDTCIEYKYLGWDGFFTECIFRGCNRAIKFADAGTTNTIFDRCIFENMRVETINITVNGSPNISFISCMFQNRTSISSQKLINCTDTAELDISNCYFEITADEGDPPLDSTLIYSIYAPNAKTRFEGNLTNANGCVMHIKNSIDYVRGHCICENIVDFPHSSEQVSILIGKNFNIPFYGHSDIPDTLPNVIENKFGNSINLFGYRRTGSYSGDTAVNYLRWTGDFYNKEKLNGHAYIIEYEIVDLEGLKSASSVPMTVREYTDRTTSDASKTYSTALFSYIGRPTLNGIDNTYKIYEIVFIDNNDIDSVNFYQLRQNEFIKAKNVYIV